MFISAQDSTLRANRLFPQQVPSITMKLNERPLWNPRNKKLEQEAASSTMSEEFAHHLPLM